MFFGEGKSFLVFCVFHVVGSGMMLKGIWDNESLRYSIGFTIVFTAIVCALLRHASVAIMASTARNARHKEKQFAFFGNIITLFSLAMPEMAKSIVRCKQDESKAVMVSIIGLAVIISFAYSLYKDILVRGGQEEQREGKKGNT